MEFMGASSEGEWSSLSGMYTAEEADFMAQLLGNCSFPSQSQSHSQASLWGGHGESFTPYCSFPMSSHDQGHHGCLNQDMSSMSMEFSCLFEGHDDDDSLNQETNVAEGDEVEPSREEKCNIPSENPRKRTRNSSDVPRSKRAKKINKKVVSHCSNDEDGNVGANVQSSSSCSEDDDSNGSQENSGLGSKRAPALNSNGKSRASRGSATDPQSLYARKRRERINERLRILQNLVPNGTKVDISTMLEEAVQYVKFLQLQIKLLSSDDMWMYAPIAYNGMDIGLDFKVSAARES